MSRTNGFFDHSAESLIRGLRKGAISPREIASLCIERFAQAEGAANAFVLFDPEKIMEQAARSEEYLKKNGAPRNLEAIPVGVKDIFNTKDYPTQMGSPLWKGFTPGNDARVVHTIRLAGAVVAGKTETAEFAVHELGRAINPHDARRTPGTSSSGSAAAVCLGVVPYALGTQTAGSIVRPASFCGVYGCKPSYGLVPRTGVLKTTDTMDSIGFLALHFEDMLRLFEEMRVHGRNYPLSNAAFLDPDRRREPAGRRWKVGFLKGFLWDRMPEYARDSLLEWAKKLGEHTADVEVEEVELPRLAKRAHDIHATIYNKNLAYYFQEEYRKKSLVSETLKTLMEAGFSIQPDRYLHALKEQEKLSAEMDGLLQSYDAMISLSTAGEAPLRGEVETDDYALLWTMAHTPVISAPAFLSPNRLPFGLQLTARRYNDFLLFAFASFLRSLGMIPEKANPSVRG